MRSLGDFKRVNTFHSRFLFTIYLLLSIIISHFITVIRGLFRDCLYFGSHTPPQLLPRQTVELAFQEYMKVKFKARQEFPPRSESAERHAPLIITG